MKKIWISGANGQLGKAINQAVDKLDCEIFNTDIGELDITDTREVLGFGEINRPDVIINCSGLTDLEICEQDRKRAFQVNALGPRNLSIAAQKLQAKMVQVSTDDVFDGESRSPYSEFDQTNPQTIYGKSKLAGENYVKEFSFRHFIIRSSWVYGEGENFVTQLLKQAGKGGSLGACAQQFGSPTSAKELAEFILTLIKTSEYGVYHATNRGVCSRYEFAGEILRLAGIQADLGAVPAGGPQRSAVRPAYAVLENFMLELNGIHHFMDWRAALAEYMETIKEIYKNL